MRWKYRGYIFQFTSSDHGGTHIHVYQGNDLLGVYDQAHGPIRRLERVWNKELREGIKEFTIKFNERGFFN